MSEDSRLIDIVGNGNVLDSPDILDRHAGDMSFAPRVRPRCVVKPANTDEVQKIVKWANEANAPLVPISSGPPHFRGDTVPCVGGAVVVDLSGMKKVMRIDPRNKVAWVEPGVTFGELQTELEKVGLSAYMPLRPRSSKSVLASILEREPITMPAHHWDCTDPMLCGEVIFGTGDKMRTGEAAGPDTTEEQWKNGKSHMTPYGTAQFEETKLISGAQGSIAINTWTSLKVRPASKLNRTYLVPAEHIEDLFGLSYGLLKLRQCDHCFILNDLNLACLMEQDAGEIHALRESLPPWVLVVSFEGYGELPEEKIEWQDADFRNLVARTGRLKPVSALAGIDGESLSQALSKPSEEPYWRLRYKGGCADLFFLATLDKTPLYIGAVNDMCRSKRISQKDVGVYIQPIVQGSSCHCEFDLYYDPKNAAETERAKWLIGDGAANLANKGAFFSRPYGPWARIAYNHTTETTMLLKKIKNIFDPRDVLNPGRLCF